METMKQSMMAKVDIDLIKLVNLLKYEALKKGKKMPSIRMVTKALANEMQGKEAKFFEKCIKYR